MSNTYNLTELRIGRNINGTPMSAESWEKFQAIAEELLQEFGIDSEADTYWTEIHTGTGTWTDGDGIAQTEDSAVVTLYWTEHGLHDGDARVEAAYTTLEVEVAKLAGFFRQDAIAVVREGRSILVSKEEVAQ